MDGTHIKANANTKKQVKVQIPAASKHQAKELMEEVNADREAHGKKPFDDDDELPAPTKKRRDNTSKKNWPIGWEGESFSFHFYPLLASIHQKPGLCLTHKPGFSTDWAFCCNY